VGRWVDVYLVSRRQAVIAWLVLLLVGAAGCGAAARLGHASIFWSGDFETGDLSQWESVQAMPGDVSVVTSPVREGSYAARFVVNPGDVPLGSGGERSEVRASQADSGGYDGSEQWYGWSTMFPSNFNPTPGTTWNYFLQWHDSLNNGCGPNVVYQVDEAKNPAQIRLRVRGGSVSLSTCAAQYDRSWYPVSLTLNHWYDFVLHVKWSADPAVGFVEGWIDGNLVIPKTFNATLYPGDGIYVKQGFYREPSLLVSTVYQDAMRRGDSYASVSPASATSSDSSTTSATSTQNSTTTTSTTTNGGGKRSGGKSH
jgi:Polysaccharide lyase